MSKIEEDFFFSKKKNFYDRARLTYFKPPGTPGSTRGCPEIQNPTRGWLTRGCPASRRRKVKNRRRNFGLTRGCPAEEILTRGCPTRGSPEAGGCYGTSTTEILARLGKLVYYVPQRANSN